MDYAAREQLLLLQQASFTLAPTTATLELAYPQHGESECRFD